MGASAGSPTPVRGQLPRGLRALPSRNPESRSPESRSSHGVRRGETPALLARRPIAGLFRSTATHAVAVCQRWGISANAVSALSLAAAAAAALALLTSDAHPWLLIVAVLLVLGRLWLNMLDGMVAIASDQQTVTGELWNELPDRLSDLLILLGAAHSGWCAPWLGHGAAFVALLVAYVGTFGQAVGTGRRFEGWMSKPWRMVALATGLLATLLWPAAWLTALRPLDVAHGLIVLGGLETVRRRIHHIVLALQARQATQPTGRAAIRNP